MLREQEHRKFQRRAELLGLRIFILVWSTGLVKKRLRSGRASLWYSAGNLGEFSEHLGLVSSSD